jgi:hypothetical protein
LFLQSSQNKKGLFWELCFGDRLAEKQQLCGPEMPDGAATGACNASAIRTTETLDAKTALRWGLDKSQL